MAPAPGHLLVPTARRFIQYAINKTNTLLRAKFPSTVPASSSSTNPILEAIPVYTRAGNTSQPTHPLAFLRQVRSSRFGGYGGRFFSTGGIRSKLSQLKFDLPKARRTFQTSTRVGSVIAKSSQPQPFASTLRPSLTGGAFPRRAGGYTLGGARNFSSTTCANASVVQNVSQAVRAMILKGERARYDGVDPVSGNPRYQRVGPVENKVAAKVRTSTLFVQNQQSKGTTLRFRLAPTVTAVSATRSTGFAAASDRLERDLAKAVNELIAINREIKKLVSRLGDLPVNLEHRATGPSLEIRFPGCDQRNVESLCDELGIMRGVVIEDEAWAQNDSGDKDVQMALLFPFADDSDHQVSYPRRSYSNDDNDLLAHENLSTIAADDFHLRTPRTATSFLSFLEREDDSGIDDLSDMLSTPANEDDTAGTPPAASENSSGGGDFGGIEGIYRFLRECDELRR